MPFSSPWTSKCTAKKLLIQLEHRNPRNLADISGNTYHLSKQCTSKMYTCIQQTGPHTALVRARYFTLHFFPQSNISWPLFQWGRTGGSGRAEVGAVSLKPAKQMPGHAVCAERITWAPNDLYQHSSTGLTAHCLLTLTFFLAHTLQATLLEGCSTAHPHPHPTAAASHPLTLSIGPLLLRGFAACRGLLALMSLPRSFLKLTNQINDVLYCPQPIPGR